MTPITIPFTKASACGNDFLIIDAIYAPADLAGFTRRICDRHNGVGADGVEWLFPAADADVRAVRLNGLLKKLGMRGATMIVDVGAVGIRGDDMHIRTGKAVVDRRGNSPTVELAALDDQKIKVAVRSQLAACGRCPRRSR